MAEKTPEELEVERVAQVAADETARIAAEAETARLAAEEAEKNKGKTPEELEAARVEAERLAAEEEAKKKQPSWEEKRLAKLAADKAALAKRLEQYETPDGKPKEKPAAGDTDMVPRAEVERLAREEAQAIAGRAAFNQQCNDAAAEGRKLFPDFDNSVKELTKLVDKTDAASRQRYDEFLEAALETGEAGKIIYALGRDLDEAERVMGLSPIKRAQELTTLANADVKQISNLPNPIKPLSGKNSGPSEIDPTDAARADKLSSAEWHKRRAAQLEKEAPAYERRRTGGR